jgi:chromosome segregation protein
VVGEDGSLELGGPAGRRGLLARKAELAELDGRVQAGQARVAELQSELSALGEAVRDLEQHQQDLRTAIYESATARAERQARRDQAGQALARAASEEPGLSAELTALERESAEVTARVDQLRRGAAELDLGKAAAEGRVAEAVAELERLRTLEGELAERIADLRVEASRSAQQRQSFAEQAAQLGSARRQAEESLDAARTRIARNVERLAEAERQVLSAEAERAGLYAAKDDADRQARERSVGRRGLPEQVAAAAETAKRLAAEAGELLAAVHKLEMTASEADVRADNLAVRVRDEYGLDLAAEYDRLIAGADRGESKVESAAPPAAGPESNVAAPEPVQGELFADRPAAAAESEEQPSDAGPSAEPVRPDPAMPIAAMLTSLSPEAARALAIQELENTDWAAVQEEINELRGKIERLGNVNLDSIAELEELEQRSGKMASQVQDLDTARKQLEELLGRLNKDSSELFVVTFAEVRKNFQELFRKLFGGGSADVFLEDESNPLECGIEIKARPPGKEPRSISLLSGGERTMTAVAMLMAVFRSRPSPFCILDEVDAALDEKNCERLGAVVKEFTDRSQFIVISHRKPTMVVADVMYGVTMQETGVSKKVAVRFNDHGQVISTDADGKEAEFKIEG